MRMMTLAEVRDCIAARRRDRRPHRDPPGPLAGLQRPAASTRSAPAARRCRSSRRPRSRRSRTRTSTTARTPWRRSATPASPSPSPGATSDWAPYELPAHADHRQGWADELRPQGARPLRPRLEQPGGRGGAPGHARAATDRPPAARGLMAEPATAPQNDTAQDAGARAVRNTVVRATSDIAGKVLSFILFAALARSLDQTAVGIYFFGLAFVQLAAVPVDLGLDRLLLRRVSEDRRAADDAAVERARPQAGARRPGRPGRGADRQRRRLRPGARARRSTSSPGR